MKKFLCLFLLVTNIGFGQMYQASSIALNYRPFLSFQTNEINIIINGNPYVDNEYKTGFTTILGKFGFRAPMRYNASKNVVEFLDEDLNVREVLRRPYITVDLDGKIYEIIEYIEDENEKLAYFNPLNQGKVQLLLMPKKKLSQTRRTSPFESSATYRESSTYYIKKEGRSAEKIRLNKKSILIHLFHKALEMNTYISDYGLNLRKEEDVVRLFDYYNSLSTLKHSEKEMQS
jgi:hypothetical protein